MKSGAINIVTDFGQGLSAGSAPLERREEGRTLRSMIQLTNGHAQATLDGTTIAEGTVYRDELVDVKTRRVNSDSTLEVASEGQEIQVAETPFIHVENHALITARTGAEDARNIIQTLTSSTIQEAEIDIQAFAATHSEAEPSLGWSYDGDEDLKLCAVGDIAGNSDIRRRLDTSHKVQLSFENLKWDGRSLCGTVTKSGYVELYRDENGGRIGTEEFTRFVLEEVIKHSAVADR